MVHSTSIVIGSPSVQERNGATRTSFPVSGLGPSHLWFDTSSSHAEALSDRCDAAVASLLIAAMAAGRPIHVEGPVSGRLLWGMDNTVQPALSRSRKYLMPVPITADESRTDDRPPAALVMTPLSCGVDSLSAIQDHALAQGIQGSHRVNCLAHAHFGHHGYGDETDDRAEARWRNAAAAAEALGLPVVRVNSNQHHFYPDQHDHRLNWLSTITVRNAAIPLLLQNGVGRFLFASGHSWREIGVGPFRDITRMDPILLPALSTDRVDLLAVGTEHTRVEKTRRIGGWEIAHRYLDVCIMDGGRNCSRCEKCLRTLLTLELLGRLEDFAGRFDLEEYRRNRTDFISRVWLDHADDHCHLEIKELMDQVGFRPDAPARLREWMIRGWRLVPHGLRHRIRFGAGG